MDLAPGAGAGEDRRLRIVDAVDRRHAGQPPVGLVVARQPGELRLAPAPHHRRLARVRQHHQKGAQRLRALAQVHRRVLAPVGLRLGARRRLHPPVGAYLRPRVARSHVAQHRAVGALVAVLAHQVLVQLEDVDRPPLVLPLLVPGGDHRRHRLRLERPLAAAVDGALGGSPQVVAHRPFAHSHRAGDLAMILALLGQHSDRHDLLLRETQRHRQLLLPSILAARQAAAALRLYVCGGS